MNEKIKINGKEIEMPRPMEYWETNESYAHYLEEYYEDSFPYEGNEKLRSAYDAIKWKNIRKIAKEAKNYYEKQGYYENDSKSARLKVGRILGLPFRLVTGVIKASFRMVSSIGKGIIKFGSFVANSAKKNDEDEFLDENLPEIEDEFDENLPDFEDEFDENLPEIEDELDENAKLAEENAKLLAANAKLAEENAKLKDEQNKSVDIKQQFEELKKEIIEEQNQFIKSIEFSNQTKLVTAINFYENEIKRLKDENLKLQGKRLVETYDPNHVLIKYAHEQALKENEIFDNQKTVNKINACVDKLEEEYTGQLYANSTRKAIYGSLVAHKDNTPLSIRKASAAERIEFLKGYEELKQQNKVFQKTR